MAGAFWLDPAGRTLALCFLVLLLAPLLHAAEFPPEQIEFFEKEIRPVLVEKCHACHSAKAPSVFAKLYLDSREAALRGGDSGPAVVPGDSGHSLLIRAVRGEARVPMPPTGSLAEPVIAALEKWVDMGAPWPSEPPPATKASSGAFDLEARRREHWAWQPVHRVEPPRVRDTDWPLRESDRFLLAKLEESGLAPAEPASSEVLIRRLTFDLTGLPPTPEEISAFVKASSPNAYPELVDRLLESPRFGEHWARHWMDLVRYAESHGSEGDPDTPEAWRYRDYLIRSLNADIPYDQLLREHVAGDLLAKARFNKADEINESILGTAHFRLVEHGFQPVDPYEDRIKWTDNQIDVFSKAFQGLTVSCARCHDHKFDAISQRDFYALYGVFANTRPTQVSIDTPERLDVNRDKLEKLRVQVKARLAEAWLRDAARIEPQLTAFAEAAQGKRPASDLPAPWRDALDDALCDEASPLHAWSTLARYGDEEFRSRWQRLTKYWRDNLAASQAFNRANFTPGWNLANDYGKWLRHGSGLPDSPSPPGEFSIVPGGPQVVSGIYPAGVYTHLLSRKHNGVLTSPRFKIETDAISLRLLGGNFSFAQLIIENYAVPRGGIYHLRYSPKQDQMSWATWDTSFWKGFTGYIEFATLDDVTNFQADPEDSRAKRKPVRDGRSWFGAGQVVFHDDPKQSPREETFAILELLEGPPPDSAAALAARVQERLTHSIEAWRTGKLDDRQAAFLDYFVRRGLLSNTGSELLAAEPLITGYRRLEDEIPAPRRAPGVTDEGGVDQPLLVRGSHQNPGDTVPRRFLEALGSDAYQTNQSGRLELARELTSARNPLTARVIVNRIWRYLFGRGIVATVDNFGKLGDKPSHPELLDFLAARFVDNGWSMKDTIRYLVTSRAYQMSSHAADRARQSDPDNALLQHMPVRRLEAEAIRDAILTATGQLNPLMYGQSVPVHYAHDKGKSQGDNEKGPLDGNGRRSVYLEIRRNIHNAFLEVFDLPAPASTRGQRDITNVPAQSLTMMNSPFVIDQSAKWAAALVKRNDATTTARVTHMFLTALGRQPAAAERDRSETYLAALAKEHKVDPSSVLASEPIWRDLAQSIFNFKEFLYIQ